MNPSMSPGTPSNNEPNIGNPDLRETFRNTPPVSVEKDVAGYLAYSAAARAILDSDVSGKESFAIRMLEGPDPIARYDAWKVLCESSDTELIARALNSPVDDSMLKGLSKALLDSKLSLRSLAIAAAAVIERKENSAVREKIFEEICAVGKSFSPIFAREVILYFTSPNKYRESSDIAYSFVGPSILQESYQREKAKFYFGDNARFLLDQD